MPADRHIFQGIHQHIEDSIATLTITHPPVNALTPDLLHELDETLDDLRNDQSVKVIIMTGAGRVFVAGADLHMLAGLTTSREGTDLAHLGQTIFAKLEQFDKPIIAAINGACLGGGLELAMCCHIRLASEGTQLGQPEINLGIIPGFGGTQRLPRLIGLTKAMEMILTGDPLSAREAKTLGLISQVFSPHDLMPEAIRLASRIVSKGQLAVRAALRALRGSEAVEPHQGMALEAKLFGNLFESDDKQEGLTAFLEKRRPRFHDH